MEKLARLLFVMALGTSLCLSAQGHTLGLPTITQRRPPAKFYHLLNGKIRGNGGVYTTTVAKSTSLTEDFMSEVIKENGNSKSVGASVGVGIGPFSASVNTQFEVSESEKSTTTNRKSFASSFASKMKTEIRVPPKHFLIVAAEMEMVVFELNNGRRKRMIVPTGKSIEGPYTGKMLNNPNLLLDSSFDIVNGFSEEILKTYDYDQIQEAMEQKNMITKVPTLSERRVNTRVFYEIENVAFRDNTIGQVATIPGGIRLVYNSHSWNTHSKLVCSKTNSMNGRNVEKLWKFEKYRGKYIIKNKKTGGRLADWGSDWGAIATGRVRQEQLWEIKFMKPNAVKIINVKTGMKLTQWLGRQDDTSENHYDIYSLNKCGSNVVCNYAEQVGVQLGIFQFPSGTCEGIMEEDSTWKLIPMERVHSG